MNMEGSERFIESPRVGSPDTPAFRPFSGSVPIVPDYELLKRIGSGSYGDVWLARSALGTWRAVKVVYRNSFEHDRPFDREFEGIRRFEPISLTHESQVKVFHVGRNEAGGYFYYVMELADDAGAILDSRSPILDDVPPPASRLQHPASSIQHRVSNIPNPASYVPRTLKLDLSRYSRLPVEDCVRIGVSLTTALAHLHEHGLAHRDVKPSNIIFVNGVPKLADIGLVTDVEATRSFVGTEGFIPPEGPGTVQADLYSLGKVLYEAAMGRSRLDFPALPADWDSFDEEEQARLTEFNEVLVNACEVDVKKRYQSAPEMREDLALLQAGRSVRHHRLGQRRRGVLKRIGVAIVAATLVVIGLKTWQDSKRVYTPKSRALKLYADGRFHFNLLTTDHHVKALKFLTEATEADPGFVQPFAELAYMYVWNLLPDMTNDQNRLERVKDIAAKAKAIDPGTAEAHAALSVSHFLERDWKGAEREIQEAIRLNPNLAIARDLYSFYLTILERFPEAHREAEAAEELQGLRPDARRVTAIVAAFPYMGERRLDGAISQLKRVLDQDDRFGYGHQFLGWCYEWQSNYLDAIEEYRKAALLLGGDPKAVNTGFDTLRQAYNDGGEQGYLRKSIEMIHARENLPDDQQLLDVLDLPGYHARLGEKEKAIEELEKHFDEPQVWHQVRFIATHESLRDDPRFKALVKRAGLKP